jgi:hypothetical protein
MSNVLFGEQKTGRTQVFDLFSTFKIGMTSAQDAQHLGHPPTVKTDENVDRVKQLVLENRRITICEAAHMLQI